MNWSVSRNKCRHGFRDGCRPVWLASPPEDDEDAWLSLEFDTWDEAMEYVRARLTERNVIGMEGT